MEQAEKGVQRLIDYNQHMLSLCRERGDELNAQVFEMLLKTLVENREKALFFGWILEEMLKEGE